MSDSDACDSDARDPGTEAPSGRRHFLKRAGAVVALVPVAAAVQAAVAAAESAASTKKPRARSRPAPSARPAAADPYATARPDPSIARTADERATLERQWKGMVEVVKVIREAPLEAATEPATIFAALPRRDRDRGD